MSSRAEIGVAVGDIPISRRAKGTIAVVGNPNAGKSSLFNRLTGMSQRTANYPGVTVERRMGRATFGGTTLELIDLPGTYSLTPNSMDERIAVEVLFGRITGTPKPDGVLAVVDSTRLYQGLYLVQQLLELGRPIVVALTMSDAAQKRGLAIDVERLAQRLGVKVFPVVATTGRGFEPMQSALAEIVGSEAAQPPGVWPELARAVDELEPRFGAKGRGFTRAEIERVLVESGQGVFDGATTTVLTPEEADVVADVRERLFGAQPPLAVEARRRYEWVRGVLDEVLTTNTPLARRSAAFVHWINQPWPATALFLVAMFVVFQAVFAWATPFTDFIDGTMSGFGAFIESLLPEGMLASFLAEGLVAGIGSVIVFLPQILILFLFIIVMEDTGYLARAAFLVDRAMRSVGLSGQSVIPLLSSFACAVPSIMATRVIPNRRDRIATILAAPFMTCSARLPVYAVLIAAVIPSRDVMLFNLQGIMLFGLYGLGIVGGVGTALVLKRTALRGKAPPFVLALPDFRLPNLQTVFLKLYDRVRVFLRRAGTVIFTVVVIVWALTYFPRSPEIEAQAEAARAAAVATLAGETLEAELAQIDNEAGAAHLEQSWLGRAGHWIEPAFRPLGWDWRVSAAVIASFPAREVVVSVLGTIYAVGGEADEATVRDRLTAATWPDGSAVYTLPMVLGLLVFYAWCLQCAATIAVIRRETNSWRWPVFAWSYMTALGYTAALLIYQIGTA